ncbi:dihydroorotate dehydrogenase electron transfer subunit [candidate division KSB1 bacterium]|nr:dihydroorotate dehydrogenase electron transfer subunit [candidate division KSB1 bacterium]
MDPRVVQEKVELVRVSGVGRGIYLFRFRSTLIARSAWPGQFVHLRVDDGSSLTLRRPFSLCQVGRSWFEILFKVVGRGTEIMARKKPGDSLDILGPLGRGFSVGESFSGAAMVAGGMGVAPFPFLIRALRRQGKRVFLFLGAKNQDELYLPDQLTKDVTLSLATEDGSRGFKGLITQLVEKKLRDQKELLGGKWQFFGCGPRAMLARLKELALTYKFSCQVSVETQLGCGMGVCQGCAVPAAPRDETSSPKYHLVCQDGPVFDVSEIDL